MAKIQFINSYPKVSVVTNSAGIPVVKDGQVQKLVKKMFRYGIIDATPMERKLYRESKVTESGDYYREENGVPLWHTSEFKGFTCEVRHYEKDGQVRFVVDSSMVDAYTAMAEMNPQLAGPMSDLIANEMLKGGRLNLDTVNVAGAKDVNDAPIDNASGLETPAESQSPDNQEDSE